MQLFSLASHFPEYQYTQKQCLTAMQSAPFWNTLTKRSHRILDKVFTSDTGITKRHFCMENIEKVWDLSAEGLNHYYESAAPKLATAALEKTLNNAASNIQPQDIDVLLVSTCTGYLCPGLSSYIAQQIGCKPSVHTQDVTGHGCGAAIPLLQIANGYSATMPDAIIATVMVEVCSAAFYVSDDVDVLISTCLFGDGASASLWSSSGGTHKASHFSSLLMPEQREKVRFINSKGKLKNQLDKSVPQMTANAAKQLYQRSNQFPKIITHGGGRDVVTALEEALEVPCLKETREVLNNYGNLSSPSVMIALERHLKTPNPSDSIWLSTFGAGFSAHSMELTKL